jgi:hypothetical protein
MAWHSFKRDAIHRGHCRDNSRASLFPSGGEEIRGKTAVFGKTRCYLWLYLYNTIQYMTVFIYSI